MNCESILFKDTRTVLLVSLSYLNKFSTYVPPYRNHELYLHHTSVGWLLQYGASTSKVIITTKIFTHLCWCCSSPFIYLLLKFTHHLEHLYFCFQGEIFRTFYQTKHLPKVKHFVVNLNSKSPFGSISGHLPFSITLENTKKPKVFLFFHGV